MPTYDYACACCGGFDALRSLAERHQPARCPGCGTAAERVFVAAPGLALMAAATRTAIATNERARHEPRSSRDVARPAHAPGCGCCAGARRGATLTGADGSKAFPGKRPWMISH